MSPEGAQWVLICQGNLSQMSLGLAGSIAFTRQGPEIPILSRLSKIPRRKAMLRQGLSFLDNALCAYFVQGSLSVGLRQVLLCFCSQMSSGLWHSKALDRYCGIRIIVDDGACKEV